MNRALAVTEGCVTLRPGRAYRAIVVVNGACTLEDLADALFVVGFDGARLAATAPADWQAEAPPDWPVEPAIDMAANECAVRISGPFVGDPYACERDMPIAGTDAVWTVAALWECRRSPASSGPHVAAGASAPAPAPAPERDGRTTALLVTAAGLIGLGWWQHVRSERRLEKENRRIRTVIETNERNESEKRVAQLMGEGLSREDAEMTAADERWSPELAALEAQSQAGT